jgi:hypothetical protein
MTQLNAYEFLNFWENLNEDETKTFKLDINLNFIVNLLFTNWYFKICDRIDHENR